MGADERLVELVTFLASNGSAQDLLNEMGIEVSGYIRQNDVIAFLQEEEVDGDCSYVIDQIIQMLRDLGI